MDEGCMDLDLLTQGPAAALYESRSGRARHSVRAGVVNQDARVGSRGGQRTARPTRRCPKVKIHYPCASSSFAVSLMRGANQYFLLKLISVVPSILRPSTAVVGNQI